MPQVMNLRRLQAQKYRPILSTWAATASFFCNRRWMDFAEHFYASSTGA